MLLIPAISKAGTPYLLTVGVASLLMSPAVIALVLTMGSEIYLQISVIGPLTVVPLFVISRLLGRVMDLRRKTLGKLVDMPIVRATQQIKTVREHTTGRPAVTSKKKQRRQRLNAPAHPENAKQETWHRRPVAPISPDEVQPDPLGLMAEDLSTIHSKELHAQEIVGDEAPDLTKLPGACVLTGKDRENAGAASDMQRRSR
jgi:hypothetical protein